MDISSSILIPLGLALAGGAGTWVKSVESRISAHDAILAKMDALIDLMLEERRGQTYRLSPPPNREG